MTIVILLVRNYTAYNYEKNRVTYISIIQLLPVGLGLVAFADGRTRHVSRQFALCGIRISDGR